MLHSVIPKLPMRDPTLTKTFYTTQLGFEITGEYDGYLMLKKDMTEIHFFLFRELAPLSNNGMVYFRTSDIDGFYKKLNENGTAIHPNGNLENKPWGQREFAVLDPDHNLLTFGEAL